MKRPPSILRYALPVAAAACAYIAACDAGGRAVTQLPSDEMLSLLMASRIEIVEPFTRVTGVKKGEISAGIELVLQAVNAMENPGLMIAGKIRVELYEFVPASGDRRGKRLDSWNIDLTTKAMQREYWNALTQMYQFHLGLNRQAIPPAERYVLAVVYESPWGDRLTDEVLIGPHGGVGGSVGFPTRPRAE